MSIGANDLQGFPLKPGVFSQMELSAITTTTSSICEFVRIKRQKGNALEEVRDFGANLTGVAVKEPGLYFVETAFIYSAGSTRNTYISVNYPPSFPTPVGNEDFIYALNAQASGTNGVLTAVVIAEGGEIIRAHTSGGLSADSTSYLRVTKIS